jgi:hypothetical protein
VPHSHRLVDVVALTAAFQLRHRRASTDRSKLLSLLALSLVIWRTYCGAGRQHTKR